MDLIVEIKKSTNIVRDIILGIIVASGLLFTIYWFNLESTYWQSIILAGGLLLLFIGYRRMK